MKRVLMGFAIGLTMGSAFAASPGRKPANAEAFLETETYIVKSNRVEHVKNSMEKLQLSEDLDFAWLNKVANGKASNFVCYSIECHKWARRSLRTYKRAPNRPEEALGKLWKDPALEAKKPEMSEEAKIKARSQLRYSRVKEG